MPIRKNFNFDDETAYTIEEIAKNKNITQTETIKKAIELLKKEYKREKRLEVLDKLAGSLTGKIGNLDAKEARIQYISEKYGY